MRSKRQVSEYFRDLRKQSKTQDGRYADLRDEALGTGTRNRDYMGRAVDRHFLRHKSAPTSKRELFMSQGTSPALGVRGASPLHPGAGRVQPPVSQ